MLPHFDIKDVSSPDDVTQAQAKVLINVKLRPQWHSYLTVGVSAAIYVDA
ncbi:MAG: hypothetical protein WA960_18415 [Tunicatimonas sp.]